MNEQDGAPDEVEAEREALWVSGIVFGVSVLASALVSAALSLGPVMMCGHHCHGATRAEARARAEREACLRSGSTLEELRAAQAASAGRDPGGTGPRTP